MSFETWIAFALLNFAYSLAPGPNAALIMSNSVRGGLRSGMAVVLGITLVEVIWAGVAIGVMVGVLELTRLRPEIITVVGALVLMSLGTAMLMAQPKVDTTPKINIPYATAFNSPFRAMVKGGLIGLSNPIALIFFVSVAPSFLPTTNLSLVDCTLFALAAVLSCLAAHLPYVGAARLGSSRFCGLLDRGCGLVLFGLGGGAIVNQTYGML